MTQKTVIIIGAGLGGISAAISARAKGFKVKIYEKNQHIGGKLNLLQKDGFSFDMGPSIFTLPQYFESLFNRAGKNFHDYVSIQPVTPHWRNFFEDSTVIDLYKENKKMEQELAKLGNGHYEDFLRFRKYSRKQYETVAKGYFNQGLDTTWEMIRFYGLFTLALGLDSARTMDKSVNRFFKHPKLQDIFNFFIKYVGSAANRAPGFFNLMPHIQFEYDLWYVKGGMFKLSQGLEKLMREMGIEIFTGAETTTVKMQGNKISGIQLKSGEQVTGDLFISNMEVVPFYERMLHQNHKQASRLEPACSGLVIHLGTKVKYPQLAHHNFFYSNNQNKHFDTVFRKYQLPDDPTLYVVAPSRSDPNVAPEGCDNIKVLPHIPYINDKNPLTREDYLQLKERVLEKLERMGLKDLRKNTICEDVWTPLDIQKNYYSNKGSIYGVVSDRQRNFGFKAPKRSPEYSNLYFTGGSVNPGGGMPMVVLCGQKVVDCIEKDGFCG
jgi:diapolycopene oxygenase